MLALLTVFLSAAAQAQPTAPPPQTTASNPAAPTSAACPQESVTLPPELERVLRDYEAAWTKKDAKGLAALFTDDGFVMSMGGTPARGREAIEQRYARAGGPLFLRAIAFAAEGGTGFILGCYAPQAGGSDIGKFTLTVKKDIKGRWLIFSDMDSPNRRR
jgi:ketosteroid isomerase-like protein